ncbi:MAG: hypothetical protein EOO87_11890 [Pedobacter sp.]|nr:MAG: hypothetical protein EOO87_11890 [Pedobacter sp.]
MDNVYFKFKEHPGDFLRDTNFIALPNPKEDVEGFLVQFLRSYQTDDRVAYLDDLYKLLHNEFSTNEDRNNFATLIKFENSEEIKDEIYSLETELKNEAFENFFYLVQTKKILFINDGEK